MFPDIEREYDQLMDIARRHLCPEWTMGQAVVLKTAKAGIYVLEIPQVVDTADRESREDQLIQRLLAADDTQVILCIATFNGVHPEIPSWNLRRRLVEINKANLQTETVLWGGGDLLLMKPFSALLPKKND